MENIGITIMKILDNIGKSGIAKTIQQESSSWLEVIKLILGALGAMLVGLVPFLIQLIKSRSSKEVKESTAAQQIVEAAAKLQESYKVLIVDLTNRLNYLETQNKELKEKVESLEKETHKLYGIVKVLITQLKSEDIEPEINLDIHLEE